MNKIEVCFELINKDDLIKQMGDMRDILPFNKIENNHVQQFLFLTQW